MTLFTFQFEISGKYSNDEQLKNNLFIFLILIVFQCEISGNLLIHEIIQRLIIKDVHPENKLLISLVFSKFHFEMSGKFVKDEHPANKLLKL